MTGEALDGVVVLSEEEAIEQLRGAIGQMALAIHGCVTAGVDVVDAFERAGIQVPPIVRPMITMALRSLR